MRKKVQVIDDELPGHIRMQTGRGERIT